MATWDEILEDRNTYPDDLKVENAGGLTLGELRNGVIPKRDMTKLTERHKSERESLQSELQRHQQGTAVLQQQLQAALAAQGVARAGGYGHVFAFGGGGAVIVETTAKHHATHPGPGVHTNHYLDADLAAMAPEASEGSRGRFSRLSELIEERQPSSIEDVIEIMKDHGSSPQAICLHPDPEEGEEASAVMFSMVTELETKTMWVAPGNPCENDYIQISLEAVA